MLESRHPLLLFGIPGAILFWVGYTLSGDVLDNFTEWNETSVGVGLAVIAVTLMGLFAMMVGLILYIMGKQVKQIQAQYNQWPKE
jgi:predicted tellurium resistance membrane protein TerC